MKNLLLLLIILILSPGLEAQQVYCDFEGLKVIHFGASTGKLDTIYNNPDLTGLNTSAHCAKYIRDTSMYDNFKIYTNSKMLEVDQYANNTFSAPRIKMKLYSSAPVGTMIQLQLGSSLNDNYPGGVHSEYIAYTSSQGAWQNITFYYLQSPQGGLTSTSNLDKVVLLIHPGTSERDTIYFDELSGPALSAVNVPFYESIATFKLYQNSPNPVKEVTHINFQLNTSGFISLKLFDMLGNPVRMLLDQNMKPGNYSIPVETENIPDGIYFYVLKKDGISRSMRMIISK
jgi:hypothetical protein